MHLRRGGIHDSIIGLESLERGELFLHSSVYFCRISCWIVLQFDGLIVGFGKHVGILHNRLIPFLVVRQRNFLEEWTEQELVDECLGAA